jgi:hypothetical protein
LKKRLFLLNDQRIKVDPRFGRPAPYLAYWLSHVVDLALKGQLMSKPAMSPYYVSIIVFIEIDEKVDD